MLVLPILNSGKLIPDAGHPIMGVSEPILDVGDPMMDTRTPSLDAGEPILDGGGIVPFAWRPSWGAVQECPGAAREQN